MGLWFMNRVMERADKKECQLRSLIRELTGKVMVRNYDQFVTGEIAMKDEDTPEQFDQEYVPAEDVTPEQFQKGLMKNAADQATPHEST